METQWKNKTIGFLGDSITEGVGVSTGECYWNYLEELLGCHSFGFGKNGAVFLGLKAQALALHNTLGDEVDAISVFAGTNDYNSGNPLGTWYTAPTDEKVVVGYEGESPRYGERKHRCFNMDEHTFRGSINCVMAQIRQFYPTKPIILLTPLHRAYACFGGDNIQYDEQYANRSGLFFDEYVAAVKEAANVWACSLIDLNALSGLFPLNDIQAKEFFSNSQTDRLHPSAKGHWRIAQAMAYSMQTIPL